MKIIGLTGGIASGKSTVSKHLKNLKIPVHESDFVVLEIYKNPTKKFLIYLKRIQLTKSIVKKKIDKKIIRDEIFNNKDKKILLEKYIHKEVKKSRNSFIKTNREKKQKIIFLDIPLLFENKLEKKCDYVVCVFAPLMIRKKRALQRKGMTNKIFNLIIKNQMSDKLKKEKSDFTINTVGPKEKTLNKLKKIIKRLIK